MKRICFIACDHGLGHLRRTLIAAYSRSLQGDSIHLLCDLKQYHRLKNKLPKLEVTLQHLETKTIPQNYQEGLLSSTTTWLNQLPSLDDYDVVISDNLPEILLVRPDAVIHAQFFWHHVLPHDSEEYFDLCEELLHRHLPLIYGCHPFTMPHVAKQKNFHSVPLYVNPLIENLPFKPLDSRKSLIITGGSTKALQPFLKPLIHYISHTQPVHHSLVLVDEQYLPPNPPGWLRAADFSPSMFHEIKSAICRPGLGIISDLLSVNIVPSPILFENNKELIFNSMTLAKLSRTP